MNRFRLATMAALAGAFLAAGCCNPCGGSRMSFFRARGQCPCPCECCSSCGGGGVPAFSASAIMSDGPMLEPPGSPLATMPPPAAPPTGLGMPGPLPPSLGAPLGTIPSDPGGRFTPIPSTSPMVPAEPSGRRR